MRNASPRMSFMPARLPRFTALDFSVCRVMSAIKSSWTVSILLWRRSALQLRRMGADRLEFPARGFPLPGKTLQHIGMQRCNVIAFGRIELQIVELRMGWVVG